MKFSTPIPIADLAAWIDAEIIGDASGMATGMNEIHKVATGDLMFVDAEKYIPKALASAATYILVNQRVACPAGKTLLLCDRPFEAYNALAHRFRPTYYFHQPVADTVRIGEGTTIAPNVVLGEHVSIGKHCIIHPNVVLYPHVTLGDYVIVHAGAVLGKDAFYYGKTADGYEKWHSIGEVVVENRVEIGANCTIDKGVSGVTRIGEGTKIDNLCHIGHGVEVGKHCIIAAQVGIAGKTTIGDRTTILGQAGVAKGVSVGADALISAQSGVSKSLEGGEWYFGSPADKGRVRHRELAALRQLPDLLRKLNVLFKKFDL